MREIVIHDFNDKSVKLIQNKGDAGRPGILNEKGQEGFPEAPGPKGLDGRPSTDDLPGV